MCERNCKQSKLVSPNESAISAEAGYRQEWTRGTPRGTQAALVEAFRLRFCIRGIGASRLGWSAAIHWRKHPLSVVIGQRSNIVRYSDGRLGNVAMVSGEEVERWTRG